MERKSELTENEILDRIKQMIGDILKVSQSRNFVELPVLTPDVDLIDDLGLDSIEIMDLITAVSTEFRIDLSTDLQRMRKIRAVVEFIKGNKR